eukprot:383542_1
MGTLLTTVIMVTATVYMSESACVPTYRYRNELKVQDSCKEFDNQPDLCDKQGDCQWIYPGLNPKKHRTKVAPLLPAQPNNSPSNKRCLAFSGGIRAAAGAYFTLRKIEEQGKLDKIKCISVISGGSWGFFLWLYEEKPGQARENILRWYYENDMIPWGPAGPVESKAKIKSNDRVKDTWWERWKQQIKQYVYSMTSLQGESVPEFNDGFRERLKSRGIPDVTVYFVVESVDPQIKRTEHFTHKSFQKVRVQPKTRKTVSRISGLARFEDYCWFKSVVGFVGEQFMCSKWTEPVPISNTKIKSAKKRNPVNILDILAYCSSAWATELAKTGMHKHLTKEFRIQRNGKEESLRLIDAGGTFNDPLLPYMLKFDKIGCLDINGDEIWNFDFSEIKPKGQTNPLGNLKVLNKLYGVMRMIGRKVDDKILPRQIQGASGKDKLYKFELWGRILYHVPLYGVHSKEKMVLGFSTMHYWMVVQWDMMQWLAFEREWNGNLLNILQEFQ